MTTNPLRYSVRDNKMVPSYPDMLCDPSMELAQALSLPGHLLGSPSSCWPMGRTEPD